jgi:carnitine 3-dehydrogenase
MDQANIKKIAVVGTGVIGSGWATKFVMSGRAVNLYDISQERLNKAEEDIWGTLRFLHGKKVLSQMQLENAASLIKTTADMKEAVGEVLFIQENIIENLEAKQNLLADIEKYAKSSAIFASSTSGFRISDISINCKHPERCIGAHPYNPPYLVPLVELTKGAKTDDGVLQTAYDFYTAIGKEPIILRKEALGFIANRLQIALYREAVDVVSRGVCTLEDVDKACVFGPGLRWAYMGPNLVFHLGSGPAGIKKGLEHFRPALELWLSDMADWKKFPENWPSVAQDGIEAEIANRPRELGKNYAEITEFRDNMLITLLKLHKKL